MGSTADGRQAVGRGVEAWRAPDPFRDRSVMFGRVVKAAEVLGEVCTRFFIYLNLRNILLRKEKDRGVDSSDHYWRQSLFMFLFRLLVRILRHFPFTIAPSECLS